MLKAIKKLAKAFIEELSSEDDDFYDSSKWVDLTYRDLIKLRLGGTKIGKVETSKALLVLPEIEDSERRKVEVAEGEVEKWLRDNPDLQKVNRV